PRPSLATRYPTRDDFIAKLREAAAATVASGFLLPEDVERAVSENLALYDGILNHDPQDRSCSYLFTD
ncbi:MAG: alpha/beta hydrolase domain-containing protein, partial [Aliidongia sp.]